MIAESGKGGQDMLGVIGGAIVYHNDLSGFGVPKLGQGEQAPRGITEFVENRDDDAGARLGWNGLGEGLLEKANKVGVGYRGRAGDKLPQWGGQAAPVAKGSQGGKKIGSLLSQSGPFPEPISL